ncbi:MAG: hypothetical protein H7Y08_07770 [Rhizobiaceae bacterium]|nr:hypothetical protein [Rhizobiaceae bacterium]
MRTHRLFLASLLFGALSGALSGTLAFAPSASAQEAPVAPQPGTNEGAEALSDDLSTYVGRPAIERGIVTVAPDPAGYRISLDAAPLTSLAEGIGATFSADPYSMLVHPQPDGTWSVSMNAPLRFDFALALEGQAQSASYDYGMMDFSGVFSPELGAFLSGAGTLSGGTMTSKDAVSEMTARFGPATYAITGSRVGNGVVDFGTIQSLGALNQTMRFQPDLASPDQSVAVTFDAGSLAVEASGRALESRALMDLWAFAIAHAEEEKIKAAGEELRRRLAAVLPLWDDFDTRYAFRDLAIATPVGTFRMDEISQSVGGDGIEAAGRYRYALGYKGLSVDSPVLPAWSASLIPAEATIDIAVADLDLDTPSRLLLDDLDVARAEPVSAATGERIAAHFAENPPRVTIEPTRLVAKDYEVTMSGEMSFGGTAPEATLKIEAKGLDAAIRTLQEAGATD